jgi:hypothetical protein
MNCESLDLVQIILPKAHRGQYGVFSDFWRFSPVKISVFLHGGDAEKSKTVLSRMNADKRGSEEWVGPLGDLIRGGAEKSNTLAADER